MFKVGDQVIYPTQGLANIIAIEEKSINGELISFYILKLAEKEIEVYVPVDNVERVGMRKLISPQEIPSILEILKQQTNVSETQWHHRFQQNYKKLQTGLIAQTAEVLRDLFCLKKTKNLAIKETRMMENAKKLLVSEIACVLNVPQEDVSNQIDEILNSK